MIQRYYQSRACLSGDVYEAVMEEDQRGEWVRYADHAAEVTRLSKRSDAVARLVEACRHLLGALRPEDFAGRKGGNVHALLSHTNDALAAVEKEIGKA